MNTFFETYHELLHSCNKPYQYVGGEFLSRNKNPKDAKVTFAFAFPDKYEIGISNLGQRVLYGLINDHPDFMADRIYAPELDFKENLIKSGKEFYSLESKTPLKDFDIIGFSLQYELAYPTVLAMMEMAGINVRSVERCENDPIILAGGPCAYNPLPLAAFVDAFLIGDGEDVILEVCEEIKRAKALGLSRKEKIKKLSEIEGVFVPAIHYIRQSSNTSSLAEEEEFQGEVTSLRNSGGGYLSGEGYRKVKKRIAQIDYENALKAYPIPFSSSVHDRAIVEIRRGCGRMCRFCQPGHVNLPVRERSAEDIIKIAKELVENTGYDEYSLLSLSSNDYSNIKEVIKELGVDFDKKKVSVSLPSQRIDGFNLELANLVQSVRKSTMTLAPEAGSQRLRDVIRKNITREQILNAALTLYENGWSKIKFYFIVGLPSETYEDLDEMAELLEEIRYKSRYIKKLKELKHSLDITCTLSIFVPKPFTPFQWAPQMNLDEVTKRIHYLKDKTKHIKGVKINYHEQAVSQIEAVLTRGDTKLCNYIEKLWQKDCYLDAWGEHFDKNVWQETAQELGLSLSELAEKEYKTDEPLPWDFIDIGVEKDWLIKEYNEALRCRASMPDLPYEYKHQPSCETGCVACGVCKNFKTKKVMDLPYNKNLKIIGNEYLGKGIKELREEARKDFVSLFRDKNIYNQSFGRTIKIPSSDKSFSNSADIRKIYSFKYLEKIISSAKYTNSKPDDKGRKNIKAWHFFEIFADFQGEQICIIINVREDNNGILYYNHSIKKEPFGLGNSLNKCDVVPKDSTSSIAYSNQDFNLSTKYRIKLTKSGILRYFSHLDWHNTFLKALARSGLNVAFSQGFNPSMKVSMGVALPLFLESDCELVDIELYDDLKPEDLQLKLEKILPAGCEILSIEKLDKSAKAIDNTVQWAEYEIKLFDHTLHNFESLSYNMNRVLSSDEILLTKKNKKGILKTTNIKPAIKSYRFCDESLFIVLKTGQSAGTSENNFEVIAALRADDLMKIIAPEILFNIKRVRFFDENFKEL